MLLQRLAAYKWLPYVLPLVAFLALTAPEQTIGKQYYPVVYTVKIIIVTGLLWWLRSAYSELQANSKGVGLGLLLGPGLTAAWVLIDRITPHFALLGTRSAYDPFTAISSLPLAWLFIVFRFFGLSLIAPIVEELFYRSFLLRFIVDMDDFKRRPLGEYNTTAFVAVVLFMASAHPEYLSAAVFSAAMNLLLYRTKNLWTTIAAHGSTNFCLGVYVLWFHAWKYW
jgi:uncharacterized protein